MLKTVILTDADKISSKLQVVLTREDSDWHVPELMSLDSELGDFMNRLSDFDAVFVTLNGRSSRAIDILERLRIAASTPVVVVGSGADAQQIVQAIRAGAGDYLDVDHGLESDVRRLLARLTGNKRSRANRGFIVSVLTAGGGYGCSTIAANLAIKLAQMHSTCALCDLKLCGGDLATMFNLQARHSIADLCRSGVLDHSVFEQSLLKHSSGVGLIAGPSLLDNLEAVDAEAVFQVVELAAGQFPFVVIDHEDAFHSEQGRVLHGSDLILVVVRLDFVTLVRTHAMLGYLEREGLNLDKVRMVVNFSGRPGELPIAQTSEMLRIPVEQVIPEDIRVMMTSVNVGNPAVLEHPSAKVCKKISQLAEQLTALKKKWYAEETRDRRAPLSAPSIKQWITARSSS